MDNQYVLVSLIVIWIAGLVLLFLVRKRLHALKTFFKTLPLYVRISTITGLILFLPLGLFVGYFSIWIGMGVIGTSCDTMKELIPSFSVVKQVITFFGGLLCLLGFLFVLPASLLGGIIAVEVVGISFTVLVCFLLHHAWLRLRV